MNSEIIEFKDTKENCPIPKSTKFSVSSGKNFYVGRKDEELVVNVSGNIPREYRDIKVAVKVLPDNENYTKKIIGTDAEKSINGYKGTIKIDLQGLDPNDYKAQLQVGLEYKLFDHGDPEYKWEEKTVVFYPKEGRQNFKITKNKASDLPSTEIELSLPDRIVEAYPNFELIKAPFKLVLNNSGKFKDVIIPVSVSSILSGKIKLLLNGHKGGNSEQQGEFDKAWCKDKLTGKLSLTQTQPSALPSVNNPDITLAMKKNCS
jgi:hypothetical protein